MYSDEMFSSDSNTRGLSDVFRRSEASKQGGSDSFSYKAPVQPKKQAQATPVKAASSVRPAVLNFCQVNGFKHVGGTPTDMGSIGAAVVGGVGCPTAQIMLYKSSKDHLCVADINSSFRYTVAGDHYASFYSNDQVAWSIRFANAETERTFALHVAIAQFLVGGMQSMVTIDEVAPKTGHVVGTGDMLGLKYTAWLVAENGACGKQLDTNTDKSAFYKIIVGDRSSPMLSGWHDALQGMKKGGKRIVVLPPALAYGEAGAPPAIPANSSAVFELEICKLKSAANMNSNLNTSLDSAAPSPTPSIPPSPVHKPAEYQMVLASPAAAASAAAPAPAPAPVAAEPQPAQQPQQQPQYYSNAVTMYNPAQAQQQQQPMYQPAPAAAMPAPMPTPMAAPMAAPPQQSALTTADTIQMMMEDRQFRSDLKATIASFETKLQEVTTWVKELRNPPTKDENVEMSGMMVIQTMQRLVDQTERYRFETEDKNQTITSLTEKVRELQDSNQRFVEDSQKMMEMRDEAHRRELEQAKVQYDALNSEKSRIQTELSQATLSLQTVQGQLVAQTNATAQVQGELARSREDARAIAAALEETRTLVARADERSAKDQQLLQEEQRAKAELSATIDGLQKKIEEGKEALANAEQLAEAQKARAASDLENAKHEKDELQEELNGQISKLQKQIAKMEANTPNVEQIEAEAEKKWKRKAELAIEEARNATDEMYQKKLRDSDKKLKAMRKEKDDLEEQLEIAQAAARKAARAANDAAPMQLSTPVATKVRVKKVVVETGLPVSDARAKFAEIRQKHHDEMVETVKNGMNGVFHALKELIDTDESYDGSAVLNAIKKTIKKSTLEYLGQLDDDNEADEELEEMFKAAEARAAKAKEAASDDEMDDDDEAEETSTPPKKSLAIDDDEDKEEEKDKEDEPKNDVEEEEEEKEEEKKEEATPVEEKEDEDEKEDEKQDENKEDEKEEEKEEEKKDVPEEEEKVDDDDDAVASEKTEKKEEDNEDEDNVEKKEEPVKDDEEKLVDEKALLPDDNEEEEEKPVVEKTPSPPLPEVKEEEEVAEKSDGRIATKQLFSDDEEDDEDDIHIPPGTDTAATQSSVSAPATTAPAKLFDDDDEDWGADEDPLSFLKK